MTGPLSNFTTREAWHIQSNCPLPTLRNAQHDEATWSPIGGRPCHELSCLHGRRSACHASFGGSRSPATDLTSPLTVEHGEPSPLHRCKPLAYSPLVARHLARWDRTLTRTQHVTLHHLNLTSPGQEKVGSDSTTGRSLGSRPQLCSTPRPMGSCSPRTI